jgi:putative ABC transport system substrate-binding protein
VLMNSVTTDTEFQSYAAVFIQGLRQFGWVEGQNLRVDFRWNAGNAGLSQTYAAQLIGLMPDVILVASMTNLTAIRQATSTVPVVFVSVSDPVAQGGAVLRRMIGRKRRTSAQFSRRQCRLKITDGSSTI